MDNNTQTFVAEEQNKNKRLDLYLSEVLQCTRSNAQKQLVEGLATVNGKIPGKSYKVQAGDIIKVKVIPPRELDVSEEDIPIEIVYEDGDLLVVNKPKGMVVHPAAGNMSGTLVNALLHHCKGNLSGINGVIRPGIVHRIDKDTSGLLIVAKNDAAHNGLAEQIKSHSFKRQYVALVHGNLKQDTGTISAPIARHKTDRKKMAVVPGGREAITHYRVLERYGKYTLLECTLETGRTHQIRVHMSSIGHPVVGDPVYGVKKDDIAKRYGISGQMLHAETIGFVHPVTGEYMEFKSMIPAEFGKVIGNLSKEYNV